MKTFTTQKQEYIRPEDLRYETEGKVYILPGRFCESISALTISNRVHTANVLKYTFDISLSEAIKLTDYIRDSYPVK